MKASFSPARSETPRSLAAVGGGRSDSAKGSNFSLGTLDSIASLDLPEGLGHYPRAFLTHYSLSSLTRYSPEPEEEATSAYTPTTRKARLRNNRYTAEELDVFEVVRNDPTLGRAVIARACELSENQAKAIFDGFGLECPAVRKYVADGGDVEHGRREITQHERDQILAKKLHNPQLGVAHFAGMYLVKSRTIKCLLRHSLSTSAGVAKPVSARGRVSRPAY